MKKHTKTLSSILLLFLQMFTGHVSGECNTCSAANNMACVSNTKFQVCVNGLPTGPINSCPSGHVCSNMDAFICKPNSVSVVVECSDCGKCDSTNTFACTDLNTYALCLGTTEPVGTTGSCGSDLVCSIDYPQICGRPDLGISATCPSSVDTTTMATTLSTVTTASTTTPAPTTGTPQQYCQLLAQAGNFPVGNSISTTCRQYIRCFVSGGTWRGGLYVCPGSTYFDVSSQLCTTTIPARCV